MALAFTQVRRSRFGLEITEFSAYLNLMCDEVIHLLLDFGFNIFPFWGYALDFPKNTKNTTGTWLQDNYFSSILSIKCASTTYMNPFHMLRCEINVFMNYATFS